MKILNFFTKSLLDFFRLLAVLLILLVLIFVIKWRTNHLFSLTSTEKIRDNTIIEEIQASKEQISDLSKVAQSVKEKDSLVSISSPKVEDVAKELKKQNLIVDEESFIALVNQGGYAMYLDTGTFTIPPNSKVMDIIHILTKDSINRSTRTVLVEIPQDVDAYGVSAILQREGIIQDPITFSNMIQEQKALERIKAGGYNIHLPIKAQELLDLLTAEQEEPVQ